MALNPSRAVPDGSSAVTIALAGDVMLGRGIDQILPHPLPPRLHEDFAKSALLYVSLAEKRNGPLRRPTRYAQIWGDMIPDLASRRPDLRIVNLETAITRSEAFYSAKGIHYRMSPANVAVLREARIDCCILANNHVLDWGRDGLRDTLEALEGISVKSAGAGRNATEAAAPAVFALPGRGRVMVFAFVCPSSGVPADWAAASDRPGVHSLNIGNAAEVDHTLEHIASWRQPGDVIVASIHWGPNWGYEVTDAQRDFAHRLIAEGRVAVVHGHSSHHPKGVERYRNRVVLYGCGDLLNDYEGIGGYEDYRPDLVLLYLISIAPDGSCRSLEMLAYRVARFSLNRATPDDLLWLQRRMDRICAGLGSEVLLTMEGASGPSLRLGS